MFRVLTTISMKSTNLLILGLFVLAVASQVVVLYGPGIIVNIIGNQIVFSLTWENDFVVSNEHSLCDVPAFYVAFAGVPRCVCKW